MRDQKKAEEVAAQRFQLLSPLLAEGLDPAKARELRAGICEQMGLSERTLRRYLAKYSKDGFAGLKPRGRGQRRTEDAIPQNILDQAILLRREIPGRSVAQIIQILEWEGKVAPGQIKRSTLQEKLSERGYSARHMRMYSQSGVAARRFQQKSRNMLWHSDIKYGPYLPIGPDGAKKQVYLVTFIDDATRFVLHGEAEWPDQVYSAVLHPQFFVVLCPWASIRQTRPSNTLPDTFSMYVLTNPSAHKSQPAVLWPLPDPTPPPVMVTAVETFVPPLLPLSFDPSC
jgi:hypothetical protein